MAEIVSYAIYLLGPLALALVVARLAPRASGRALALGYPAFLVAWIGSVTAMSIATALEASPFVLSLVISAAAGLFEESARYAAFRFLPPLRARRDWPNGVMYAVGHSGARVNPPNHNCIDSSDLRAIQPRRS